MNVMWHKHVFKLRREPNRRLIPIQHMIQILAICKIRLIQFGHPPWILILLIRHHDPV